MLGPKVAEFRHSLQSHDRTLNPEYMEVGKTVECCRWVVLSLWGLVSVQGLGRSGPGFLGFRV